MFGKSNLKKGADLHISGDNANAIKKLNKAILSGELDNFEMYSAYLLLGSCYYETNEFDESISALQSALQWGSFENDHLAYRLLGLAYSRKGNYESSLQYLDKAIELMPTDCESLTRKGLILGILGRYNEAETAYNTALRYANSADPNDINLNYIDAIHHFRFITRLEKKYSEAEKLQMNKDYVDAVNIYNSILESIDSYSDSKDDDYINVIHVDSLLNKGRSFYALKQYDSAIEVLKKVFAIELNNGSAHYELAGCYIRLGKFDEAIESYTHAEYCSDNNDARVKINALKKSLIVQKLLVEKDYQAALDEANSIPEIDEQSIFMKKSSIGKCRNYLGNYDEALKYLLPYADADLTDTSTVDNIMRSNVCAEVGKIYNKQKNYETALKYLNKSIQLNSDGFTDTWLFMGESYIELGQYEKAIEPLRKAIEGWDPNEDYDLAYIESRLKFAKEKLGDNAVDETEKPVCPDCGAELKSGDSFCRKCGRKLKDD